MYNFSTVAVFYIIDRHTYLCSRCKFCGYNKSFKNNYSSFLRMYTVQVLIMCYYKNHIFKSQDFAMQHKKIANLSTISNIHP